MFFQCSEHGSQMISDLIKPNVRSTHWFNWIMIWTYFSSSIWEHCICSCWFAGCPFHRDGQRQTPRLYLASPILLLAAFMSYPNPSVLDDASTSVIWLNDQHSPLNDGQTQANLVRLIKSCSRRNPCFIEWIHIKGHSNSHSAFNDLSPLQGLNIWLPYSPMRVSC